LFLLAYRAFFKGEYVFTSFAIIISHGQHNKICYNEINIILL
jgi:hypothetical protein